MMNKVKSDIAANSRNPKGIIILLLFRLANYISSFKENNRIVWIIGIPYLVFYRVFVEWILGVEIPAKTQIGRGLTLHHGQSLVVNDESVIGENVTLRHNTTIGCLINRDGTRTGSPRIGNKVDIGVGVIILGEIRIGDNVRIGAGTVILKDVPEGSVVVGNPARILDRK